MPQPSPTSKTNGVHYKYPIINSQISIHPFKNQITMCRLLITHIVCKCPQQNEPPCPHHHNLRDHQPNSDDRPSRRLRPDGRYNWFIRHQTKNKPATTGRLFILQRTCYLHFHNMELIQILLTRWRPLLKLLTQNS